MAKALGKNEVKERWYFDEVSTVLWCRCRWMRWCRCWCRYRGYAQNAFASGVRIAAVAVDCGIVRCVNVVVITSGTARKHRSAE